MSARVFGGVSPVVKPHAAVSFWITAGLFVVSLLWARVAMAAAPTVYAPTGPQSGGYFTGTYSFATYISCDSGVAFSGSYANNLDGTHTFNFVGAPDGSLLVKIDGGGAQLISSCGAPFATPQTSVAFYTVTKGTPPAPTPTPTPPPTPAPTPVPAVPPASGGGSGGISGSGSKATPTPVRTPPLPGSAPAPLAPDQPAAVASPNSPVTSPTPSPTGSMRPLAGSQTPHDKPLSLGWLAWATPLLLLVIGAGAAIRNRRVRHILADAFTGARIAAGPYVFRVRVALRNMTRGHELPRKRGLSHREHSGKLLAHHHTSYPSLVFLILVTAVTLAGYSVSSSAESSQQLSATVLGPAPATAPTLTQPFDGDSVSTAVISVRGVCDVGMLVGLTRNGGPSGSAVCDGGGLFVILTSLTPGTNQFIGYTIDGLGQRGPASTPVNVTYVAPVAPLVTPSATPPVSTSAPVPRPTKPKTATKPAPVAPLLIMTDELYYQGVTTGRPLTVAAGISGGRPPYTVDWDWGDGSRESMYAVTGRIQATHTFTHTGSYRLVMRVTDAGGNQAASTTAVIVTTGAPPIVVTTQSRDSGAGSLAFAWPILIVTALLVISFWLGEQYKREVPAQAPLIRPML